MNATAATIAEGQKMGLTEAQIERFIARMGGAEVTEAPEGFAYQGRVEYIENGTKKVSETVQVTVTQEDGELRVEMAIKAGEVIRKALKARLGNVRMTRLVVEHA